MRLCVFCAGYHSYHELLCATAMPRLQGSMSQHSSSPSSSSILSVTSSEMFSPSRGWGLWNGCSIYAWLSIPSFLFFKQLWLSSLATIHYHKTGFPTSWTAQIYECKYKYLEVTLTTWLFSKTTSTGPPLGPKTSLAIFYPPVLIVQAWIAKRWQVRMNYSQRCHYRSQEKLTYMLGKLFTITKSQVSKIKHLPEESFPIHVISKPIWNNS